MDQAMNTTNPDQTVSSRRLHHLDALRGVAALSVAVGHVLGIVPAFESWTPLLGRPAVTLFFLLSGYVLGKSLAGSGSNPLVDFPCYCVRRIFRLYPAIFAALIIAALLAKFYVIPSQVPNLSGWFAKSLTKATTIHGLHDYFGSFRLYYLRLDPPLWTIQIEFVCSFLLPFLVWPMRWSSLLRWGVLVMLVVIRFTHPSWLGLASYLFEFYLGYLAWTLSPQVTKIPTVAVKFLISLLLLGGLAWMWFQDRSGVGWVSVAVIATFLALAGPCGWEGFKVVLNTRPLQFLGRISYSLYLIHLPILMICWSIVIGRWNVVRGDLHQVFVLMLTVLPISLILADVMERCVERPFNDWGHRISRGLNKMLRLPY